MRTTHATKTGGTRSADEQPSWPAWATAPTIKLGGFGVLPVHGDSSVGMLEPFPLLPAIATSWTW